jgi:hypothetical protein
VLVSWGLLGPKELLEISMNPKSTQVTSGTILQMHKELSYLMLHRVNFVHQLGMIK